MSITRPRILSPAGTLTTSSVRRNLLPLGTLYASDKEAQKKQFGFLEEDKATSLISGSDSRINNSPISKPLSSKNSSSTTKFLTAFTIPYFKLNSSFLFMIET